MSLIYVISRYVLCTVICLCVSDVCVATRAPAKSSTRLQILMIGYHRSITTASFRLSLSSPFPSSHYLPLILSQSTALFQSSTNLHRDSHYHNNGSAYFSMTCIATLSDTVSFRPHSVPSLPPPPSKLRNVPDPYVHVPAGIYLRVPL